MGLGALARHRSVRGIAIGIVVGIVALCTRCRWDELTDAQVPHAEPDTRIYREIAERPFGWDLAVYNKPLFVPIVYRVAHNDAPALIEFQTDLAFLAWTVFTASLVLALRRRWTRAIAIGLGIVFLLAPTRVGFAGSLLSESIGDSLAALVAAGAIAVVRLRGRARVAAAVGTGVLGLAWLLTRDTNAVIAVTAAGVAMVVWRGWRQRWAWCASGLVVLAAAGMMWSSNQPHPPLPYQQPWDPRFTPRSVYPMIDNIITRVLPDQRDELPAGLRVFAEPTEQVWRLILDDPAIRPLHDWLLGHGASTYGRWLIRHPLDRVAELIDARWVALVGSYNQRYMPAGWSPHGSVLRRLTMNHALLMVLMLASPLLLRGSRADPLTGLVLCMIASGVVGAVAAFYGDAAEVSRHCYGAGQQIVLGLFLALVVWLDQVPRGWPVTSIRECRS
jgi:hypothetical protein